MELGDSFYYRDRNTTLNWCPSDSESEWKKNLSVEYSKNLLASLDWHEDSVQYQLNSHGFRADEFDDTGNGIIFLGCSYTMGIGIDFKSTWTYKVANQLKLKNWNLGQGGCSNDTCYRLGSYWIPELKPKMVVMLAPSKFRMEICQPTLAENFLPTNKKIKDFYGNWLSTDINSNLNIRKNVDGLHLLCYQLDIPFYYMMADDAVISCRENSKDLARDLLHPGRIWNQNVANKFLEMINDR